MCSESPEHVGARILSMQRHPRTHPFALCVLAIAILAGCQEKDVGAPTATPAPTVEAPPVPAPVVEAKGIRFVESPLKLADTGAVATDFCAMRVNGARLVARPLPVRAGEPIEITGWMGDEATKTWPTQPMLLLEHASTTAAVWRLDLQAPVERSDVARRLGAPTMLMSGFDVQVDLADIPNGNYRLYGAHTDGSGQLHVCRRGGALTVSR